MKTVNEMLTELAPKIQAGIHRKYEMERAAEIRRAKASIQQYVRTFNKTDCIAGLDRHLRKLGTTCKELAPEATEFLEQPRLVSGENFSAYYVQPEGFWEAIGTLSEAIDSFLETVSVYS